MIHIYFIYKNIHENEHVNVIYGFYSKQYYIYIYIYICVCVCVCVCADREGLNSVGQMV